MAENETVKKINEELLDAFTSWYNKVASEVTPSMNYTFSRPFIGGVCDNFGAGKKNIMIVGQEARGLNDYGKSLKEYQMWSIGFMSKQLGCKKYLKIRHTVKSIHLFGGLFAVLLIIAYTGLILINYISFQKGKQND